MGPVKTAIRSYEEESRQQAVNVEEGDRTNVRATEKE